MDIKINGWDWTKKNAVAWTFSTDCNAIYEVDVHGGDAVVVGENDTEPLDQSWLYSHVFQYKDKIIFSPVRADDILVYHRLTGRNIRIELPKLNGNGYKQGRNTVHYWNAFQYKGKIYLFGAVYPRVLKVDLETHEWNLLMECPDDIVGEADEGDFITDGYVIQGCKAYLPLGNKPAVLILDLLTDAWMIKEFHCSLTGFSGIAAHGNVFYMLGRKASAGMLLQWDSINDTVQEIVFWEQAPSIKGLSIFYAPVCLKGDIYIFPASTNRAFVVKGGSNRAEPYEAFDRLFLSPDKKWEGLYFIKVEGEDFVFQTKRDQTYYRFNPCTDTIKWKKIFYLNDDKYKKRLIDAQLDRGLQKQNFIIELNECLQAFLRVCTNKMKDYRESSVNKKTGSIIYQKMKGNV